MLLDLSPGVAVDRELGRSPDRHGPVEEVSGWFSSATVECEPWGRAFLDRSRLTDRPFRVETASGSPASPSHRLSISGGG
jgi:hypothetical protein